MTPALRVQEWIAVAGAKTAYIERGSPWENRYIESFNARLRDATARFSTLFARHRSSSRVGDALQHDQAPRLNRIQATNTRGVRARIRQRGRLRYASAGHAGATANLKLTFHLDHSAGADHSGAQF